MTAWGKMDHSKYDGKCAECGDPYIVNAPLYFFKGIKSYFCGPGCLERYGSKNGMTARADECLQNASQGTKAGQTPASPQNTPPAGINAANRIRCDACGEEVPAAEIRVYMDKEGLERPICNLCRRMAKAQRVLKIIGLWKPVKAEDKEAVQ